MELDRTMFYPQGGGQAGDTGELVRANGARIAIADTRKGETLDSVVHVPAPAMRAARAGRSADARLDWDAAHALHAPAHRAARDVVRRRRAGRPAAISRRTRRGSTSTST